MTDDLERSAVLLSNYQDEYEIWESAARQCKEILVETAKRQGIYADTHGRPKDHGSVLTKANRTSEWRDLPEFSDLAGGRCVVRFKSEVDRICEALHDRADIRVIKVDQKVPGPNSFAYQGVHLDVELLDDELPALPDSRPIICELQVRTKAQDVWSVINHELVYKGDPSDEIARKINRLVVLAELMDDEAEVTRREIAANAKFDEALTVSSYRLFQVLRGRQVDRPHSTDLISIFLPTITLDEAPNYIQRLEQFVLDSHYHQVIDVIENRSIKRDVLIADRPEVLIVLERLVNARTALSSTWQEHFQSKDLERLAAMIGLS